MPQTAAALIADGLPLTAKQATTARRQAAAGDGVFRPYSGPGGLQEELTQFAADNPTLVKLEVLGKAAGGKNIIALKVTNDATKVRDGKHPAVLYISARRRASGQRRK